MENDLYEQYVERFKKHPPFIELGLFGEDLKAALKKSLEDNKPIEYEWDGETYY